VKQEDVSDASCLDSAMTTDGRRSAAAVNRYHHCEPESPVSSVHPSPVSAAAPSVDGRWQLYCKHHQQTAIDLFHR